MAPCKETTLQTVRSVQEMLICCSCREQAAVCICRSRVQRVIRISDVLFIRVALTGPSVSLTGRGETCGIHIYKAGGISVNGKQMPQSSGTVQSEIFQLYVSLRASPKVAFPCRRDVQAQERRAVCGPRRAAVPVQPLVSFCCCVGWGVDCTFFWRSRLKITAVIFTRD